MAHNTGDKSPIPDCLCGIGKMNLFRAGETAKHTGRMFYKCPANLEHKRAFLWCDIYHRYDPPAMIPDYVLNQTWKKNTMPCETYASSSAPPSASHESSTSMRLMELESNSREKRPRSDLEEQLSLTFMALVLILLGIIVGKLM